MTAPKDPVRVKPLEWEHHPVGTVASAGFAGFAYMIDTRLKRPTIIKGLVFTQEFPTLEAAKAEAQADYEARILSAIEVDARADIVDELAQALEGMTEHYAQLANSGDAGFWDCEEEPEVIAARAALARYRGGV